MTQTQTSQNARRYDIDWLRTLAFGILILYHVGMYYVADWGWHIKNEQTFAWLQDVMILSNPWRMSLLFFISGMALALVADKYKYTELASIRTRRLMLPLLFGMFVIVAPQPYYEALDQGLIEPGFWAFWLEYINPHTTLLVEHHSPIGLLTWNHLWFLPYLWCYSLLILLLAPVLKRLAQGQMLIAVPFWMAFFAMAVILMLIWLALRQSFPSTHALLDDWYNHGKYFSVFVLGYVFPLQQRWWQGAIANRNRLLLLALCTYSLIILDNHQAFPDAAALFNENLAVKITYGMVYTVNHWAWILAVLGLAGHWLNKPSPTLRYANDAILPWYMLHQTLIIVAAANLKSLALAPGLEAVIILLLTSAGCYLGYEIAKRSNWLRPLFGLKMRRKKNSHAEGLAAV
ncbi:acyltransferase family protein [Aliiglaciecola sp. CAU 1673]|uniref:acyltransferase family protein n=1 Tax=Aliiglaciecola sp. CAU 1673 TaxID=3032595 RepID=UPI0023DAFC52|nr:acyltransferase family protein [Aliiglaciecola sp. CAU 1673]MDF2177458.1 acyltransferase family protein [Aliiglaciecola sp. CAU 1673]